MSGNLIDLSDEGTSSQNTTGINGIHRTNGLVGRMSLSENRARSPPRNHFAGLDVLMRQRQSSTPVPSPAPRPVSLPPAASVPRFATRLSLSSEMFSPLAQPYRAPESVASFLQEQQEPLTSALRSDQPIPEYIPENRMEFRSMIDTINDYNKATDSESDHRSDRRSSSPPVPDLELSVPTGPDTPPTPTTAHGEHPVHDFRPGQTAAAQTNPQVCGLVTQELKRKLAAADGAFARLKHENTELTTKLGLIGFHIESTENQNAAMSRAMSEKDAVIKKQELEMKKQELEMKSKMTGIQDLDAKLKSKDAEIKAKDAQLVRKEVEIAKHVAEIKKKHQQLGARNALINKSNPGNDKVGVHGARMAAKDAELAAKDAELAALKQTFEARGRKMETTRSTVKEHKDLIIKEQQKAADHQRMVDYYLLQNQHLADAATAREKTIADLRQELVVRKFELTDAQEQRGNRGAIEDIKGKLREMTTLSDRQRAQLKDAKDELKFKDARIMDLSNNGERLRGAIHVVPPRNVKLPETVVACIECYSMDRSCDSGTKCRPCMENNTECLRFMCSLKYKNGNCPLVPCPLTHDGQGFLMLPRPRPEW
ncbi:uncharacterized protein J4E78_001580 [Alternaria triticimaculans]|uniref:uncharacterized protein n=1 Tax=Alternaria triticimaculans TaxID=297637 RepID=UPI0020C4F7B4|nr:uncharacterized protein J4E78_001580 [Alternaria triticimaculans]KAI4673074.1 hypothetical protein J4E78_001580 [Alternaria triticimaculans]